MHNFLKVSFLLFVCAACATTKNEAGTTDGSDTSRDYSSETVMRLADFLVTIDGEVRGIERPQLKVYLHESIAPSVSFPVRVDDGTVLDLGIHDRTLQMFETGSATYDDLEKQIYLSHNGQQIREGRLHLKLLENQAEAPFSFDIEGWSEGLPFNLKFQGSVGYFSCSAPAEEIPSVDPNDVGESNGERLTEDKNFESERCKALLSIGN